MKTWVWLPIETRPWEDLLDVRFRLWIAARSFG